MQYAVERMNTILEASVASGLKAMDGMRTPRWMRKRSRTSDASLNVRWSPMNDGKALVQQFFVHERKRRRNRLIVMWSLVGSPMSSLSPPISEACPLNGLQWFSSCPSLHRSSFFGVD